MTAFNDDIIGVSIHASREGRDAPPYPALTPHRRFQSTRPVKDATAPAGGLTNTSLKPRFPLTSGKNTEFALRLDGWFYSFFNFNKLGKR